MKSGLTYSIVRKELPSKSSTYVELTLNNHREEMKMKLGNALVASAGIDAILMDAGNPRKMSFRVRARLSRINDILKKELDVYEAERVRLVKEFGEEVEKDGEKVINVLDANLEDFYKELEKVLATELDVVYKKVTPEEFKDIEELNIDITDAQLKALFEHVFDESLSA